MKLSFILGFKFFYLLITYKNILNNLIILKKKFFNKQFYSNIIFFLIFRDSAEKSFRPPTTVKNVSDPNPTSEKTVQQQPVSSIMSDDESFRPADAREKHLTDDASFRPPTPGEHLTDDASFRPADAREKHLTDDASFLPPTPGEQLTDDASFRPPTPGKDFFVPKPTSKEILELAVSSIMSDDDYNYKWY